MPERWVSVQKVADHLGVNKDTIDKWIDARGLPAHRVGRLWKFQLGEVDAWVRDGKAGELMERRRDGEYHAQQR